MRFTAVKSQQLLRGFAPTVSRMALHQAKSDKLIFAPAGGAQNARADQFLQHESRGGLHRRDLDPTSPITQFHAWFSAAQSHSSTPTPAPAQNQATAGEQQQPPPPPPAIPHPETCTLSTASLPSGRVSARMVYMKELDHRGFVVYSNFGTSRKARDLESNPWASLVFWWEALERQVRVEGRAERLGREESQAYYDTRVRGSRLGAWASRQSAVLVPGEGKGEGEGDDDGRAQLQRWVDETEERFKGTEEIPVPEFWGGLRIVPERVEFWQGRENRLHDRFVYEKAEGQEDKWTLERLSP